MKFTRHAWGVFRRGIDLSFKGRGPETLLSTHKTQITAEQRVNDKFRTFARRLTKAERNPQ